MKAQERFNEMVFEDRNKQYGAYQLRRSESENILRSVIVSTALTTLLVLLTIYLSNRAEIIVSTFTGPNTPVVLPPLSYPPVEPPKILPKIREITKVESVSGTPIVKDKAKDDGMKVNSELPVSKINTDSGTVHHVENTVIIEMPKTVETVIAPDQMPYLENMNGIMKMNLRYPQVAIRENIEGIVYISFIVEADGSLSEIKAVKTLSHGCTEEAIRVVKLLEGWKPGIKNGRAVRVPCTLPVKFILE